MALVRTNAVTYVRCPHCKGVVLAAVYVDDPNVTAGFAPSPPAPLDEAQKCGRCGGVFVVKRKESRRTQ